MIASDPVLCENGPRCIVQVFEASINGRVAWFEADPHPEGMYEIRRHGISGPLRAVRLTVTQQFGKTDRLYRVHKCPAKLRRR